MARSARTLEIDGEGAFWAVAGFAASLVVVPAEDRPILRTTRLGIAATAHALANAR